jgi:hypothetical protein
MTRIALIISIAALGIAPVAAMAQRSGDLQEGARVRVVSAAGESRVGTVVGFTNDSVSVVYGNSGHRPTTMALSDATQIEVSDGVSRGEGATMGGVMGVFAGGFAGWASARLSDGNDQFAQTLGTAAGAIVGGILGATIGAARGAEHWTSLNRR